MATFSTAISDETDTLLPWCFALWTVNWIGEHGGLSLTLSSDQILHTTRGSVFPNIVQD